MPWRSGTQDIDMSTFFKAPIDGGKVYVLLMDTGEGTGTSTGTSKGTTTVTCIRISDEKVKNLNKLLQDLRQDYSMNGVVVKDTDSRTEHIELEGDRMWDALSFLYQHRIITKRNDFGYLKDANSLKLRRGILVQEKENSSPKA